MTKTLQKLLLTFASLALFASQANATLVLEQYASGTPTPVNIGGWDMTDLATLNGGLVNDGFNLGVDTTDTIEVSSPSDVITFLDAGGNDLALTRNLANNASSWWINGESFDYDIFTTSQHVFTIVLPENTRAFSFNVGAKVTSTGMNAWLTATETPGSGIGSQQWFNVNTTNTPGFAIYSEVAADGSCSALTSVTIDPLLWGAGNFSINQGACTQSVPEPSTYALFGLGLCGLLLGRRLSKKPAIKFVS